MKRIAIVIAVVLGVGGIVCPLGYLGARSYIGDALAQGASEQADAGVPDTARTPEELVIDHKMPDVVKDPGGTLSTVREWYTHGGLTFAVLVLLLIASTIYTRMKPHDTDGDGAPDVSGTWRDRSWVISGAVLMAGFPVLDKMTGMVGVSWGGVMVGLAGAVGLLMSNLNPIRGLKTSDVQDALAAAKLR